MKILLIGSMLITLSACNSVHNPRYGDAPGDPCIKCGENWIFIQNEPFGALKQSKRQGHDWNDPSTIAHY